MNASVLLVCGLVSLAATARASDDLESPVINETNAALASCLTEQVRVAANGSLGDLSFLQLLYITIDDFNEANPDGTKADFAFTTIQPNQLSATKKYVLRLTSTKASRWEWGFVANLTYLTAPFASSKAEFFDHSLLSGTRIKKKLFAVDLENCRALLSN